MTSPNSNNKRMMMDFSKCKLPASCKTTALNKSSPPSFTPCSTKKSTSPNTSTCSSTSYSSASEFMSTRQKSAAAAAAAAAASRSCSSTKSSPTPSVSSDISTNTILSTNYSSSAATTGSLRKSDVESNNSYSAMSSSSSISSSCYSTDSPNVNCECSSNSSTKTVLSATNYSSFSSTSVSYSSDELASDVSTDMRRRRGRPPAKLAAAAAAAVDLTMNTSGSNNSSNCVFSINSSDSSLMTVNSNETSEAPAVVATVTSASSRPVTRNTSKATRSSPVETVAAASVLASNRDVEIKNTIEDNDQQSQQHSPKKCLWNRCQYVCAKSDLNNELFIDHIKSKHIFTQKNFHRFRCLWKGCNVYNNPSCSFNWLERHVIDHIDKRPFLCIFNGCNRKFRTELAREKHVQSHINTTMPASSSLSPSPVKTRLNQKQTLLNSCKLALLENIKSKSMSNLNGFGGQHAKTEPADLSSSSFNDGRATTNGTNGKLRSSTMITNGTKYNNGYCMSNTRQTNGSTPHVNGLNGHSSANTGGPISKFQNYAQLLKALTKKRKAQNNADQLKKRFKKANYKDFFDTCSVRVIEHRLGSLNYDSGSIMFKANVIASQLNSVTGVESFLIEWEPKNIIENEWLEKSELTVTKYVDINDLKDKFNINDENPFYNRHRFRLNRRK